jgi:hypothetical protein
MTSEHADRHQESLTSDSACGATKLGNHLPELPSSPWRSIGKRLDYSTWPERDRFIELDAAIVVLEELVRQRNAERPLQIQSEHAGRKDDDSFRFAA